MADQTDKTVLMIGTLDTKGAELAYLKSRIEELGCRTILADVGVIGGTPFEADIAREEVAAAGGEVLSALVGRADRGWAMEVMTRGMTRIARDLYGRGRFDGVVSIGGSGNATVASAAMRALPLGVPKMMTSIVAALDARPYIGGKDITMMYSVVDIAGLNRVSRQILDNTAGAICGMVKVDRTQVVGDRPIVAATMFGVTTPCVKTATEILESHGYETIVFAATGVGGRTMEELVADGLIAGVLDITTTEWADELFGGILAAGPHRLEAAGRKGIPQVVAPGAVDMVNFGPMMSVPENLRSRLLYRHNSSVTLMRTTVDESRRIGQVIAQKLNDARGPASLFLPLKGVSAMDKPGQPFYSPPADGALFEAIRQNLGTNVELVEIDAHINDPVFAESMACELIRLLSLNPPVTPKMMSQA